MSLHFVITLYYYRMTRQSYRFFCENKIFTEIFVKIFCKNNIMEINLKKFKALVEDLKKKKIATKGQVANAMGYKSNNNLTEILSGRVKLPEEKVRMFCEKYKVDINTLTEDEITERKDFFTENILNEPLFNYSSETTLKRIENIKSEFTLLYQTQKEIEQITESTYKIMKHQTERLNHLKQLIGL